MNFQDVILTLERYWGARGCVLLQPHDLMMGAGTFHPATTLRSLGPGAWRCAYVQPCRRPGDGRYGDNPNRLGHYYQYQVILKPSPVDVQDLYLGSLEAIGIDLRNNDVRFVEVHCEELPASYVEPALGALARGVVELLGGIRHGAVRTWATPRRLAVAVADVEEARPKVTKLVTGPPADRSFGADGDPTPAAVGFARARGADLAALRVMDGPKGRVVAVEVTEGGEATRAVVAKGLSTVVAGLPFPKTMEWGTGGARWARPVAAVNAIYDGVRLQGRALGLPLSNHTVGHRLAENCRFAFRSSAEWLAGLRERAVEPDCGIRRQRITELLDEAQRKLGCDPIRDEELLDEVQYLVEAPTLVVGVFDPASPRSSSDRKPLLVAGWQGCRAGAVCCQERPPPLLRRS